MQIYNPIAGISSGITNPLSFQDLSMSRRSFVVSWKVWKKTDVNFHIRQKKRRAYLFSRIEILLLQPGHLLDTVEIHIISIKWILGNRDSCQSALEFRPSFYDAFEYFFEIEAIWGREQDALSALDRRWSAKSSDVHSGDVSDVRVSCAGRIDPGGRK